MVQNDMPFEWALFAWSKEMINEMKAWARRIKLDVLALFLAGRDPRVPWLPKVLAVVVAGYALSPIDLIPDFIPVLGYLDDLILVPVGIMLAIKLIPSDIMTEHRANAKNILDRPMSQAAALSLPAYGFWRWL